MRLYTNKGREAHKKVIEALKENAPKIAAIRAGKLKVKKDGKKV